MFFCCFRHEGRTWYTAHRGRLWIASAAKVPTADEISHTNNFYRLLKGGIIQHISAQFIFKKFAFLIDMYFDVFFCFLEDVQFPKHYPTSCLLGCVTVTQVLPQEEYRKKFPEGESTSPYVFICEDFHQLPIRFPIQGKHKLCKFIIDYFINFFQFLTFLFSLEYFKIVIIYR